MPLNLPQALIVKIFVANLKVINMKTRVYDTFSIKFYCEKGRCGKDEKAPVHLCVIRDGDRWRINLPIREDPNVFKRAVAARSNNPIKQYLNHVVASARDSLVLIT